MSRWHQLQSREDEGRADRWGALPQKVVLEVRRGKTSVSPVPSPTQVIAARRPVGPHCQAKEYQPGMSEQNTPSSNVSPR